MKQVKSAHLMHHNYFYKVYFDANTFHTFPSNILNASFLHCKQSKIKIAVLTPPRLCTKNKMYSETFSIQSGLSEILISCHKA